MSSSVTQDAELKEMSHMEVAGAKSEEAREVFPLEVGQQLGSIHLVSLTEIG